MIHGIDYFKALADETRLRILFILLNQELNVNELVSILAMGQSRISRHLKILTSAGLLTVRRDGLWSFYSVPPDGEERCFIDAITYLFRQSPPLIADQQLTQQIIQERKTAITHFFNAVAGDWERIKHTLLGDCQLNQIIKEHILETETIADLGCGTGDLIITLKEKARLLIGVDSSPKMLEKVKARLLSRETSLSPLPEKTGVQSVPIDLRLGEVEHLPLREAEADYAILNLVLHHLPLPVLGLKEAYRVLKSTGYLIVTDFEQHAKEDLRSLYGDRWLGFIPAQLESWFKEAGFTLYKQARFTLKQGLTLLFYLVGKIQIKN
jgi:ArsR family transcriptional regulator